MARLSSILKEYIADREPVVVDMVRLNSCCEHLRRHLGKTQASRLTRQRLVSYLRRRVREGVQPQTVRRAVHRTSGSAATGLERWKAAPGSAHHPTPEGAAQAARPEPP